MAELAAAGSVVGLISLSIQACQGLTTYYSAWRSYDEEIRQIYRNVDELKITCENLERELQRIAQDQEPAVQQIFKLIVLCRDGINSLAQALDRCHLTQIPDSIATRIGLLRARALYPFKKQTLQTLQDNVRGVQGNLTGALQILQLHLSAGHEQQLSSLVRIGSGTEKSVHNNQIAIQALSPPVQVISQTLPLIQQQTQSTAITVRAALDEARGSRHDTQIFQDKVLQVLTNLASSVDNSPRSLETGIAMTLDRHLAGFNQLKQEMYCAHSQPSGEVLAKLDAMDQSIKGLQISMISKPGLMQSVCEESYRLKNLPGSDTPRRDGGLQLWDGRMKKGRLCSCKTKSKGTDPEAFAKSSSFEFTSRKFAFETESLSHLRTCPLFVKSAWTTVARFRIRSCGALLARAIDASMSITRGAGGLSISSNLQCARVVPYDSPAFKLVRSVFLDDGPRRRSKIEMEAYATKFVLPELERLFCSGKASPYDVDSETGDTLLHAVTDFGLLYRNEYNLELTVYLVKRLVELCVPLNWTNDSTETVMNQIIFQADRYSDRPDVPNYVISLFETGAEFTRLPKEDGRFWFPDWNLDVIWRLVDCAEFVQALELNQVNIAVLHQSQGELLEALRHSPQSVNGLGIWEFAPLHLAVRWPDGIRILLQHGACVDSIGIMNNTPLYYATELGLSETVSLLTKADPDLQIDGMYVLSKASQQYRFRNVKRGRFHGKEATPLDRGDVIDTLIASLAERRRDLQDRLVNLSMVIDIDTAVFRDDRVLDEYAEYAECVERNAPRAYDSIPLRPSSLLIDSFMGTPQTVFCTDCLTVEIAEKLWQTGFRDIDVPDKCGLTPLMLSSRDIGDYVDEIEVCAWLVRKGAKLHRPHCDPSDYNPDRTLDATGLPQRTRALHFVAAKTGWGLGWLAREHEGTAEQLLHEFPGQASQDARLLMAAILADVACDDCVCACSSHGCLASTMMLKSFHKAEVYDLNDLCAHEWSPLAVQSLIDVLGPQNPCWIWLAKGVIRFRTFQELQLRHTCCRWKYWGRMKRLEPEEVAEIRDEDHEKIELLESLLQEFDEHRGDQDLMSFFKGYWATRMDQVLQEQGGINEEGLRGLGVVLHQEEGRVRSVWH